MPPLYLTFALMLFCFSSISSSRVVLSLSALNLDASPSAVGMLVGALYVFPLVLSWPVGVLSDRLGSRWLLLFGTACGSCGMLIPYFFPALPALYFAALTMGMSFTFYNVLLQNLVGVLSTPQNRIRNFSNSSMFGAATLFIGPLVGGLAIDHLGHVNACLSSMGLAFIAFTLLLLWGGRLPGGQRAAAARGSVRQMLRDPGMLRILFTSSLVQMGQDLFQFYLPIYGHGIGLSASAIGVVLASFAAAYFVVRIIMPRLIARLGEEALLGYSFYVAAAGFALVPFFKSELSLILVAFMFGCGMGSVQQICGRTFRRNLRPAPDHQQRGAGHCADRVWLCGLGVRVGIGVRHQRRADGYRRCLDGQAWSASAGAATILIAEWGGDLPSR